MYKVYFVDDEEWLINELKNIIDWQENGFTICGYSSDPFDALEEILKLKPTLVISDIYMDGINGLELAQQVYEKEREINFCFLSAYDKFEYAVKALKLGAIDYLTKPLKTHELLLVLNKVKLKQEQKNKGDVIEKFILGEEVREEELRVTIQKHLGEIKNKNFRFVVVDGKPSFSSDVISLYSSDDYIIGIVLELDLNKLNDISQKEKLNIGCGIETNIDGDLKQSLITAYYCSKQSFINDDIGVVVYDNDRKCSEFKLRIDKCENKYELKSFIDTFEEFVKVFKVNVYDLNKMFNLLISKAIKQGVEFNERVTSKKSVTEKFSNFNKLIAELKSAFDLACNKSDNSIINNMVKDVQLNFSKEQSLDSYAKKYGYNASYLSMLFKKEMGQSFTEYLIALRLSKAKELMLGTTLSVGEIAFLVGYNDYFHFTKSFKSNVGCSPSEYRKKYGKN